jgi:hypothetical protein
MPGFVPGIFLGLQKRKTKKLGRSRSAYRLRP